MNKYLIEVESVQVNKLMKKAKVYSFLQGETIIRQYARASRLCLLIEGEVGFYFSDNLHVDELRIGKSSEKHTPFGLGALSELDHNSTTVKVESPSASVLMWTTDDLQEIFEGPYEYAAEFLNFLNQNAHKLIVTSADLLVSQSLYTKKEKDYITTHWYERAPQHDVTDTMLHLMCAPFFEGFDEKVFRFLSEEVERRQYKSGDVIFTQDKPTSGINILVKGEVEFCRTSTNNGSTHVVFYRAVSTPGYIIGSSGILDKKAFNSAIVKKETILLHIPLRKVEALRKSDTVFSLKLQQRVLWLINNELRAVRARMVTTLYKEEVEAVSSFIDGNKAHLSIDSGLHAVPHLLKHPLTQQQAFDLLHDLELKGEGRERNLASLCLDNLHETRREMSFFKGLNKVYQAVVQAPRQYDPKSIQELSISRSKELFTNVSIEVYGYQNLPEDSGHIFIYNHLLNHPYYTLPNNFQITLDSHFLNTLIYERYGIPNVRMVRIGKDAEFAHQEYYERFGFINVHTQESEQVQESKEEIEKRRKQWLLTLEKSLGEGQNLIISPEGTSYPTELSPGKFKSGTFHMAMKMKREPLIVPVVLVNFDKRVKNNVFACKIGKPFRISEELEMSGLDLRTYLDQYQQQYKEAVSQLAHQTSKEV